MHAQIDHVMPSSQLPETCMYVCMYVYICLYLVCMYACKDVRTSCLLNIGAQETNTPIHTFTYIHIPDIHPHTHIPDIGIPSSRISAPLRAQGSKHTHTYIYIHPHTHIPDIGIPSSRISAPLRAQGNKHTNTYMYIHKYTHT